ncbi:MAG: hypothetical protein IJL98_05600, partial [Lachnospiraceae bacterium]|nr:hypothetical protein [Lachnospiraceae bacterium]
MKKAVLLIFGIFMLIMIGGCSFQGLPEPSVTADNSSGQTDENSNNLPDDTKLLNRKDAKDLDYKELLPAIQREIREIVRPWTSTPDVFEFSKEDIPSVCSAVYEWMLQLEEAGIITSCAYNENGQSVSYAVRDGGVCAYI